LDNPVKRSIFVITGTDTGVGKTVLACLLAGHLRDAGVPVAALKPVCSGDRDDARRLCAASGAALTLDEINPWHFRSPQAPLLAARQEGRTLKLTEVLARVRRVQKRFQIVLVEGAGGLLSPLGENFDSRDLILALDATPIVVCPNRLGAINQTLLVLAALPPRVSRRARIMLVSPERSDRSSLSNPGLLAERLGPQRVHVLPRLKHPKTAGLTPPDRRVRRALRALLRFTGC
jgi:dethiobiotin synthetase